MITYTYYTLEFPFKSESHNNLDFVERIELATEFI